MKIYSLYRSRIYLNKILDEFDYNGFHITVRQRRNGKIAYCIDNIYLGEYMKEWECNYYTQFLNRAAAGKVSVNTIKFYINNVKETIS